MLDTLLAILGWTAFGLAIVAGLLLDMVGLFGNWIILAAVGAAYGLSGFEHFGGWTLPVLAVLAVLGEVAEFLASGAGAATFGGSRKTMGAAVAGCILGAIVGTPLFPVIGTIIGACAGAFVGATLYEFLMQEKSVGSAAYIGVGAAMGKVAGILAKAFVGVVMLGFAFINS